MILSTSCLGPRIQKKLGKVILERQNQEVPNKRMTALKKRGGHGQEIDSKPHQ